MHVEPRTSDVLFGWAGVTLGKLHGETVLPELEACIDGPALGERLEALGVLTAADRHEIDRRVRDLAADAGGSEHDALEALGGRRAVLASLRTETPNAFLATRVRSTEMPWEQGRAAAPEPALVEESPGRYRDARFHARGAMGEVYVMRDEALERDVAYKLLTPRGEGSTATAGSGNTALAGGARFLREARIAGQLEHPAVVPVHELGRRPDGSLYYTMKFVRGRSLERAVAEAAGLQERLELMPHFLSLCQAIAYAHSRGIIHRDIKPGNVMIGEFGETVVIDWGLAKARGEKDFSKKEMADLLSAIRQGEQSPTGTIFGEAIGTPAYMSPEQAQGMLDRIDERSDVYALGAVLYTILTGQPPFERPTLKRMLHAVVHDQPQAVVVRAPKAPRELVAICRRCMEKNFQQRYQSASELVREIERYQSGALVDAYEYRLAEHAGRLVNRNRPLSIAIGAALLLFAVSAGWYNLSLLAERDRAELRQAEAEAANANAQLSEEAARARAQEAQAARNDAEAARLRADHDLYVANVSLAQNYLRDGEYRAARDLLDRCAPADRHWEWGWLQALCHRATVVRDAPPDWNPADGYPFAVDPVTLLLAERGRGGGVLVSDLFSGRPAESFLLERFAIVPRAGFGGDGRFAFGLDHNTAKLLDIETRAEHVFEPFLWLYEWGIGMSGDGSRILVRTAPESIAIFSTAPVAQLGEFPGIEVTRAMLSHDGALVAALGLEDGAGFAPLRVWPADGGGPAWEAPRVRAGSAVFAPRGERIAYAGGAGALHVAAPRHGGEARTIDAGGAEKTAIAFAPDGARIAWGEAGGGIAIAGIDDALPLRLQGHKGPVRALAFSRDGARLLSGSDDRVAIVWDAEAGALERRLLGHSHPVTRVQWDAAGLWAITDNPFECMVWRRDAVNPMRTYEAPAGPAMVLDGDAALIATERGAVHRAELGDATVRDVLPARWAEPGWPHLAPGGRHLLLRGPHRLEIVDMATGAAVLERSGADYAVARSAFDAAGTRAALFLPEGAAGQETIEIVELATGATAAQFPLRDRRPESFHRGHALGFTPDGSRLAIVNGDVCIVYDVASGKAFGSFATPPLAQHPNAAVAFDPAGRRMALATAGGVSLIDFPSGAHRLQAYGHAHPVTAIAFSGDGARMVTGDAEGNIKLWDAITGQDILPLPAFDGAVDALRFTGDGRTLVAAGRAGALRSYRAFPTRDTGYPGSPKTAMLERVNAEKLCEPGLGGPWHRCQCALERLAGAAREAAAAAGLSPGTALPEAAALLAAAEPGCPEGGTLLPPVAGVPPRCARHGALDNLHYRLDLARALDEAGAADDSVRYALLASEFSTYAEGFFGTDLLERWTAIEDQYWHASRILARRMLDAGQAFIDDYYALACARTGRHDEAIAAFDARVASTPSLAPELASRRAYAHAGRGKPGDVDRACGLLEEHLTHGLPDRYTDWAFARLRERRGDPAFPRVAALERAFDPANTHWTRLPWHGNLDDALREARDRKCFVFLDVASPASPATAELQQRRYALPLVQQMLTTHYALCRIDGHEHPEIVARYGIQSFPTLLALDAGGAAVLRLEGTHIVRDFWVFGDRIDNAGKAPHWAFLGPLPPGSAEPGAAACTAPGFVPDAAATYPGLRGSTAGWRIASADPIRGLVECTEAFTDDAACRNLALTFFTLEAPARVRIDFTAEDRWTLWLDGEAIARAETGRLDDLRPLTRELAAGPHVLGIETENASGGFPAGACLTAPDGSALPGLRFDAPRGLPALDPTAAFAAAPAPDAGETAPIVLDKDELLWEWRRAYADILLATRPRPFLDANGREIGIALDNAGQVPLLVRLGLRDGDVVLGLNGLTIADRHRPWDELSKHIENREDHEVQLLRGGQTVTLTYRVK